MSGLRLYPTLTPGKDETTAGFASRLGRLHGCRHLRNFFADMDLTFQALVDGDPATVRKLAQLAGADQALLINNAVVRDGNSYKIRGQALNKGSTLLTYVRVCPHCAAEDIKASGQRPALAIQNRVAWQIASIRTCPEHNLALANLGVAGKTNSIHDFAGFIANNEKILEDLEEIERQPSALELYLQGRLDGAPSALPLLDGLEFHAAAKLCEMIGAVATGGRDVKVAAFSNDDWRAAGGAGFAKAKDGEPAIRAFLADLQTSFPYTRAATEGPQAVFGQFYKWLAFSAKDEPFEAVRAIVRQHVIETTPVGPGDTILGQPVETRRWHSVYTASQAFGAHPKRLRKILDAKGLLQADHASKANNHVLFDAAAAQALHDDGVFDGLTIKELETYSGAGRVHAKLLVTSGVLVPAVASGDVSDTGHGWVSIPKQQVDDFLACLRDGAIPVEAAGDGQFDIPSAAKRANCSAIEIVRLILDKKLAWTGRLTTAEKYMSVLVDLDEIKTETRNLPPLDGLTAEQVQKTLHYSWPVVRALIDHKILATEDRINPVNRCPVKIIKTDEIDRFRKTYVSLTDLAEERGLHPTLVKRFLDEEGVKPALGKAIYHATFYRRSQA